MTTNPARAFRKGLAQLRVMDVQTVQAGIRDILGVTTRQSFISYADGKRTLDVEKARRIQDLFTQYGVSDCWGLTD